MALETKITATIEASIDRKSFWDWVNYARDTGKKLDQELKRKLELDVAGFWLQLDQARKTLSLAKKSMDEESKIKAQLDVNELSRSLTESKRQLNNYVNTGDKDMSRLQAKFNQITGAIKDQGNAFLNFSKNFIALWVTAWLTKFTGGIISLASGLEQAKVSFTSMLWSAKEADVFLKDLSNFAKETPFELVWVREQAKLLKAYWFETAKIIPTLQLLGNASLGNSEKMGRLVYALWQVRAKTVLAGDDLKQFTETGIPLVAKLAEVTGYSAKQITSDTKSLGITYEQVYQALQKYSDWLWNTLEAQSKTFAGSVSNFKDSINILWEQLGGFLIKIFTPFIKAFNGILAKVVEFGEKFPVVSQVVGIFIWAITLLSIGLTAIWFLLPWLISGLGLLGISFTGATIAIWWTTIALWTLMLPITAVIATIALLATAWTKNRGHIQEKTRAVVTVIKAIFKEVEKAIENMVRFLVRNFDKTEIALDALTGGFYSLLKWVIKTYIWINASTDSMEKNVTWTFWRMKIWVSNIVQALFWWLYNLFQSGLSVLNSLTNWYVGRIMNTIGAVLSLIGKSYKASLGTEIWLSTAKTVLKDIPKLDTSWSGWGGGTPVIDTTGWSGWGGWGKKKTAEEIAEEQEKIEKEKAEKLIKIEESRLKSVAEMNIEAVKKSQKSEYDKAKEIKQINKDLEDDIASLKKDQSEKEADLAEETIKKYEDIEKSGKEAFESINKEIWKSVDTIKKLNEEIDWVDKKLWDITNDIWKRVIEIEKEIKSIGEKQSQSGLDPSEIQKLNEEKLALEQELSLAKQSITSEELQKVRNEEAKSATQKLLDQRSQLEQERKDLEDKVKFETDLLSQLVQEKINLEQSYTEQYKIELNEQDKSLKASIDNKIRMYKELELAKKNAEGWEASPFIWGNNWNGGITTNNNKTSNNNVTIHQYIQASINNDMDIDELAQQLARKQQLATKWIE